MIFVCEGGQTPIGNGKHGLKDGSYKVWGTMVNQRQILGTKIGRKIGQ